MITGGPSGVFRSHSSSEISYHAHFFIEDISQVRDVLEHGDVAADPTADRETRSNLNFVHETKFSFFPHRFQQNLSLC